MNGWVFDIAGERGGMTVWFRTEAGETIALFAPFRPSFVLAGNRLKEPALRAANKIQERWSQVTTVVAAAPVGQGPIFSEEC